MDGVVKPSGQKRRHPCTKQVHPGCAAGHQRPSGEYRRGIALLFHYESNVFWRMARAVHHPELESSQVDLVVLLKPERRK
jgi:hypothetical protein